VPNIVGEFDHTMASLGVWVSVQKLVSLASVNDSPIGGDVFIPDATKPETVLHLTGMLHREMYEWGSAWRVAWYAYDLLGLTRDTPWVVCAECFFLVFPPTEGLARCD